MTRLTRIELFKESFKFSSGHFTIFSGTERENLHGHNFTLHAVFDAQVQENGMIFDYFLAKRFLESMCRNLNEYFLLPAHSKHLRIEETEDYVYAHFNGEKIPFLRRDIRMLPVENISVEELSHYFLQEFLREFVEKNRFPVSYAEIKVFSGPGQSGAALWGKPA
jgi:6-pyruvoyltetrahydropterin/6-carboxytetrahydropterin synthase